MPVTMNAPGFWHLQGQPIAGQGEPVQIGAMGAYPANDGTFDVDSIGQRQYHDNLVDEMGQSIMNNGAPLNSPPPYYKERIPDPNLMRELKLWHMRQVPQMR